jgi:valyl-tRNA synthetase
VFGGFLSHYTIKVMFIKIFVARRTVRAAQHRYLILSSTKATKTALEDPSLFVKFKLKDENAYLLGWTTTPWSLPGNAAIAVNPDAEYVYVRLKDDDGKEEVLILVRDQLEVLNVDTYPYRKRSDGQGFGR